MLKILFEEPLYKKRTWQQEKMEKKGKTRLITMRLQPNCFEVVVVVILFVVVFFIVVVPNFNVVV